MPLDLLRLERKGTCVQCGGPTDGPWTSERQVCEGCCEPSVYDKFAEKGLFISKFDPAKYMGGPRGSAWLLGWMYLECGGGTGVFDYAGGQCTTTCGAEATGVVLGAETP